MTKGIKIVLVLLIVALIIFVVYYYNSNKIKITTEQTKLINTSNQINQQQQGLATINGQIAKDVQILG